jgi:hypothetical protein
VALNDLPNRDDSDLLSPDKLYAAAISGLSLGAWQSIPRIRSIQVSRDGFVTLVSSSTHI